MALPCGTPVSIITTPPFPCHRIILRPSTGPHLFPVPLPFTPTSFPIRGCTIFPMRIKRARSSVHVPPLAYIIDRHFASIDYHRPLPTSNIQHSTPNIRILLSHRNLPRHLTVCTRAIIPARWYSYFCLHARSVTTPGTNIRTKRPYCRVRFRLSSLVLGRIIWRVLSRSFVRCHPFSWSLIGGHPFSPADFRLPDSPSHQGLTSQSYTVLDTYRKHHCCLDLNSNSVSQLIVHPSRILPTIGAHT